MFGGSRANKQIFQLYKAHIPYLLKFIMVSLIVRSMIKSYHLICCCQRKNFLGCYTACSRLTYKFRIFSIKDK
ncbi:hypothetical protein BDZ91DRAFT_720025 [Kalaharituber pfeilii]|nr:hypothetical protein BDZ91DRAFT_720025 [Kalaharituber pfeilii]